MCDVLLFGGGADLARQFHVYGAETRAPRIVEHRDEVDRRIAAREQRVERGRLVNVGLDRLSRGKHQQLAVALAMAGGHAHRARGEVEKCAAGCEYYAEHAPGYITDEPVDTDASRSLVAYEPLGTVLAVMPWNFPFWQVFRFAAPALAAGNTALLKHASNVPQCALAIERVFKEAGAPDGVFRTLMIASRDVEGIIAEHRVQAVTLTGSESAGRKVAAADGEHLKKSVLGLGGSGPFNVLEDCDLQLAV